MALSDCPSAAMCFTAAECNGILSGRFNLNCHITNPDVMGQHNKTGGVTFGATVIVFQRGGMRAQQRGTITFVLLVTPLLMQPRIHLDFQAASADCWLMSSFLSTGTLKSSSQWDLLPVCTHIWNCPDLSATPCTWLSKFYQLHHSA